MCHDGLLITLNYTECRKQPVQGGHSDPPLSIPESRKYISPVKVPSLRVEGIRILTTKDRALRTRKPALANLATFLLI